MSTKQGEKRGVNLAEPELATPEVIFFPSLNAAF